MRTIPEDNTTRSPQPPRRGLREKAPTGFSTKTLPPERNGPAGRRGGDTILAPEMPGRNTSKRVPPSESRAGKISRSGARNAPKVLNASDMHWSLAFFGLMLYAFVEYSRLPEMYPIFQMFQLGKLAIVFAALGFLTNPRLRANAPSHSKGLDIAVLIFVVGNFFSSCLAAQQYQVWSSFLDVLLWGAVYFLMTRVLVNSWQMRIFLFMLFVLNLKLAQHTVREYVLERSMGIPDMDIILKGGAGQGSSNFFGNVADLGLAMAVVWGMTWALLIGKSEKKKLNRWFLIACFVVFLLAILFCGSRGAVVGAAAIVLVALCKSRKFGAIFLAFVFVLGVWFVLPGASKERFRSAWDWQHDANASSRVTFWKAGLVMFEENPILGVGPGNFPIVNPFHYVSHSLYIQVLAESGAVGTVCIASMVIMFFRLNGRTRKRALATRVAGRRSFEYCLAVGLDLALVGYLSSGAFLSVLYYPHLWILLGLSVALYRCLDNQESAEQVVEKPRRRLALATP